MVFRRGNGGNPKGRRGGRGGEEREREESLRGGVGSLLVTGGKVQEAVPCVYGGKRARFGLGGARFEACYPH